MHIIKNQRVKNIYATTPRKQGIQIFKTPRHPGSRVATIRDPEK